MVSSESGFISAASMHDRRSHHTATILRDGRVLVTGGTMPAGEAIASAEIYDPAANSWLVVRAMTEAVLLPSGLTQTATAQTGDIRTVLFEGLPIDEFLSAGGMAALFGADTSSQQSNESSGHGNGRHADTFVNDPCLDPAPPGLDGTIQSEPEIAVLNTPGSMAKKIVAGYNDTRGFSDRNGGLSGFAYSTDGGTTWIDGGGLPPLISGPGTASDDGKDAYFGDPVLVVHQATQRFFYASIYKLPDGSFTLSVNRGTFQVAPAQGVESAANTRCLNDPTQTGVPDPPQQAERIVWEPPVVAVRPTQAVGGVIVDVAQSQDFLDKPWLYVDQTTGTLYMTYTRFALDGEATLELARCKGCALKDTFKNADWDGPFTIVPNEPDTLNQGSTAVTTTRPGLPGGPPRVVVTWFARTFVLAAVGTTGQVGNRTETQQRIGYAYSDDDGRTWSDDKTIAVVNPQLEPPGYNRGRTSGIADVPSIAVDKGADDGVFTSGETSQAGFGTVYVTYFSGKYALPRRAQQADIFVSGSTDNGTTFGPPVQVNDDPGTTSHVFPTVQVNKNGSVFVGWLDRRNDPNYNVLTDAWASVSKDNGQTFKSNQIQSDVATSWYVRSDARPNFGDYMSSDLLGFGTFVMVWPDGRFRPPGGRAATPDTIFTIVGGLGQ